MKDLDDIVPEQDMNLETEREAAKNGEVQSKRRISDEDKSKKRIPVDDKSNSIHKKKHQKKKTFKAGDKDVKFEAYNGRRNNKALAFIRQFEVAFAEGNFKERSKLRHVSMYLKGTASSWWLTQILEGKKPKDWSAFKEAFYSQFLPPDFEQELQCLNLRDCWRLPEQTLGYIGGLSRLSCLDMQNVYTLTDTSALTFLTGNTTLRCLNLSGTGVSDGLLEALTYGLRLRAWSALKHISGATACSTESSEHKHKLLEQWKPLNLVYLRLQHTKITEAAVPLILAFEQLLFVDVRDTEVSGRSLKYLQAKHKLVSLPNNAKMLARWNSLIVAAFKGLCGCLSLKTSAPTVHDSLQEQPERVTQWEQHGVIRLLLAANRLTS
ncbi:hypothetical protein L7F22_021769 [Adiantum nelumboides]|nr:hypothetical protein [Adiantum nelumboides]